MVRRGNDFEDNALLIKMYGRVARVNHAAGPHRSWGDGIKSCEMGFMDEYVDKRIVLHMVFPYPFNKIHGDYGGF